MEQIFPSIDTHREKRVELGVLIEPTTSACYGSVRPEAAPFSTRPRTEGLGWLQPFNSKMPMTADAQSKHYEGMYSGFRFTPAVIRQARHANEVVGAVNLNLVWYWKAICEAINLNVLKIPRTFRKQQNIERLARTSRWKPA